MIETGLSLKDLRKGMTQYPQTMINVKADREKQVWLDESVRKAVLDAECKLADTGRVLLRPSGTEPLVRVMVEGESADLVSSICQDIANEVETVAAKC